MVSKSDIRLPSLRAVWTARKYLNLIKDLPEEIKREREREEVEMIWKPLPQPPSLVDIAAFV